MLFFIVFYWVNSFIFFNPVIKNVPGYVRNPGSPREGDAASKC